MNVISVSFVFSVVGYATTMLTWLQVECYDIVGESQATTEGTLLAQLEKARIAAPSILLLNHVEALAKKSESAATGKAPSIVNVLADVSDTLRRFGKVMGWPGVLIGSTADEDTVPKEILGVFKQEITLHVSNVRVKEICLC